MSHSHTKIWIHTVFSTKKRISLINTNLEFKLYSHIKDNLEKDLNCKVKSIGGMPDHIHILFLLSPNYSIKDILKNIKGESSKWVTSNNLSKLKFSWQTGYGAFSVSESKLKNVEEYIRNQKEHHKKGTTLERLERITHDEEDES